MPYRRYYRRRRTYTRRRRYGKRTYRRRRYRKRSYRKRRTINGVSTSKPLIFAPGPRMPIAIGGFPPRKKVTLRYCEKFNVTPGVSTNSYPYSMNGMFDPYLGTGGHQPLGFDQMMAVYQQYCVIACKATAQVFNESNSHACWIGWKLNQSTTTISNTLDILAEKPDFVYRMVGQDNSEGNGVSISTAVAPLKWLNKDWQEGTVHGTDGTNPAEQLVGHFTFAKFNSDAGQEGMEIMITIEYTAVFWDVKDLAQS